MAGITRIYSRSAGGPGYQIPCTELVWTPEIEIRDNRALPLHPAEQIKMCPKLVGKNIITLSEHIILWFLREIREEWLMPDDVELYCDSQRIQIDYKGELIDKWPGGFFTERADLLF